MRAASNDPDFAALADTLRSGANQQQFYAEQYGRTSIPIGEVYDANKYNWIFSAYWEADRYLVKDGIPGDWKVTLVSSCREASSRDARPDALYTFEFALPDGRHVTYKFQLDETGPVIGPP
jgi:hypothetical protein